MKKTIATVLLTLIVVFAPWRLFVVVAETIVMKPGHLRETQRVDGYWQAMELEARLIALGWVISYQSNVNYEGQEAYGITNNTVHQITIDENLRWNDRLAVLAHEAGHTQQPGWAGTAEGEAFAEMVATLVCHCGFREHARYLARVKVETLLMAFTEWDNIYAAAATLEAK